METLQNPLIREDVARDSPDTLDSAFMLAKDSLTLQERLRQLGERGQLKAHDPKEKLKVFIK